MKMNYAIALHGGAGVIPNDIDQAIKDAYLHGLELALYAGKQILIGGGSALEAVEQTVIVLEDYPYFNAGKGSVFTADGEHEMDASIMDGSNLKCGAIAGVNRIKNPIHLARKIMEETKHILLIGDGAMRFAESQSVSMENDDYFYSEFRYKQLQQAKSGGKAVLDHSVFETDRIKKKGTVGAVALDQMGNLAAATSTGGMTNKRKGRVGDTALIGSGTYADNRSAAISCTGDGEEFIRHAIAYDVHAQMIYGNKTLQEAVDFAIHKRLQPDDGGLIAIDSNGLIVCDYNSSGMFRAYSNPDSGDHIKIWE